MLGRLLADISRNLPNKPIDVEHRRHQGQRRLRLVPLQPAEMPVDDYPTLPAAPETSGTIAGDVFTQAVAQVSIAADRGDTLPILTGVRMEIDGDKMTLLATDRYRLAMRELTWKPRGHRRQPRRAHPGPPALRHGQAPSARPARSSSPSAQRRRRPGRLRGRSASHDDPPARRRVPQGHLDLPDLASTPRRSSRRPPSSEAVKRVALVAERNTPVRLKFTDGQVAIEAGTGDDAQASEAVEATLTGPEIEIAFNPQFLLDGLGAVGTAYAGSPSPSRAGPRCSPARPRPDGEPDTSYRYVLMPVRFAS